MPTINNDWTEPRIQRLKTLFREGLSLSHIAAQMAMTRNAIVGKCARLNLKRDTIRKVPKPRAQHVQRLPKTRRTQAQCIVEGYFTNPDGVPAEDPSDRDIPLEQRRTVKSLGFDDCKFPCGDPATPTFFFCGSPRVSLLPYCATHARRCYRAS